MNRRAFFRTLASGLTVATFVDVDPARVLWVPGKKLISIPAPRFDPRFLVRVRAGKAGYYKIPTGLIRSVTQKLPACEVLLQQVHVENFLCLAPARSSVAIAVTALDLGVPSLGLWPEPAHDTVLAVEYFPMPPAERARPAHWDAPPLPPDRSW